MILSSLDPFIYLQIIFKISKQFFQTHPNLPGTHSTSTPKHKQKKHTSSYRKHERIANLIPATWIIVDVVGKVGEA